MRRIAAVVISGVVFIASLASASGAGRYRYGDLPNPTKRANAEPGMAVDGGGNVWVSSLFAGVPPAPNDPLYFATPGSGVWKSTDGGRSYSWMGDPLRWTPPSLPSASFAGGDSDIAAAPVRNGDGHYNVYAVALYPGENSIALSRDGGKTWIVNPLGGLPGFVDRPWVAADGACKAYLAYGAPGGWWVNRYDFCGPQQGVSKEPESGVRVSPRGPALTFSASGKIVVDTSRTSRYRHRVYLPLEVCSGSLASLAESLLEPEEGPAGCPRVPSIVVARSTDRGLTWKRSEVAKVPNRATPIWPTTIGTDRAGTVYVAWHDNRDSFLSFSTDGGRRWSRPRRINAPGTTAVYPTVAATGRGRVVVAWYGTTRDGDSNSEKVMGPAGERRSARWSLYLARSRNFGRDLRRTVIDPLVHRGVLCTMGTSCRDAAATRALLDNFGVVMVDGRVAIAYTSDQPGGNIASSRTRFATEI